MVFSMYLELYISEKILIELLKSLVEHGFISRKDFNTVPPKVEYSLLEDGKKALKILDVIDSF